MNFSGKLVNLINITIVLGLLCAVILTYQSDHHESSKLLIEQHTPSENLLDPRAEEIIALINDINEHNQKIKNFVCQDLEISIEDRMFAKVDATIFYEKDRNFRMIASSLLSKELDIGSNQSLFWFWSNRMSPRALHYSSYEHMYDTNLKTPFNPLWIKETLGFDKIDISDNNSMARKRGNLWEIIQQKKSISGRNALKITLIDPTKKAIIGHYVYERGQLICSTEILSHAIRENHHLPSKMVIRWHLENITMVWRLGRCRINVNINPRNWEMPNIHPRIDMGQDHLPNRF